MPTHKLRKVFFIGAIWAARCFAHEFTVSPEQEHGVVSRQTCGEDLAQRLSSEARIYCPGSPEFDVSIQRWSTLAAPTFRMSVEVASEDDVAEVVRYANEQGIPFLAVNNAHGAIVTVGRLKMGIMIWMRRLDSVDIAGDGRTATFGGGILDKAVTDALWAAGKQTVTGGCECVSVIGPGLGGGHGFLQARHGLVSDQFTSLNMVLANGSLQTIDDTHELWWAVRGAGHNFGIVTSITSKIYDVMYPTWAYHTFTFTGDKVEAFYTTINEVLLKNGTQPVDIFSYSVFARNVAIDADNPIITFYLLQEGTSSVDPAFTTPFLALSPATTSTGSGPYPNVPSWIGWHDAAPTCQNSTLANTRYPLELQDYSIPAQRRAYDLFSSTLSSTPALNRSVFVFEGYSQQGVKAIPSASSAYPFRGSNLLVSPIIRFVQDGDALTEKAKSLGEALRDIMHEASGLKEKRVYVNYAFGTESERDVYGDEEGRVERLGALKMKYDPEGRFSFYAPIGG